MKGKPCNILVVDDEEEILELLKLFVSSEGHSCCTAATGAQALELCRGAVFDGAIVDIRLPGMDGIELTRHLIRRYPRISVMVMTGFAGDYSEDAAVEAGARDFITKPFNLGEFSARFRRMMRDHQRIA